jgi:large subunit ribosomal protein LP2
MKYLAAYLLVQLAKEAPEASDIKTVLESAGIDADMDQIKKLMTELAGKSIDDLVAQGSSKLASMPAVGAAPAAAGKANLVYPNDVLMFLSRRCCPCCRQEGRKEGRSQGRIRRGHGLRFVRLNVLSCIYVEYIMLPLKFCFFYLRWPRI